MQSIDNGPECVKIYVTKDITKIERVGDYKHTYLETLLTRRMTR